MTISFDLSIEVSEKYKFNKEALSRIEQNTWVKNKWPLVYFIQNKSEKIAYVGESTNFSLRIKNHLSNESKSIFNEISIIGSDKFNKSATLDIESKLISYISSEGTYTLQNGNGGLINHNYYQQDLYKNLFKEIWVKLVEKQIVSKSLEEIESSALFKYSPYKSLNETQYSSVLEIMNSLNKSQSNVIFIKGCAGTGKTILATYLIKLLNTDLSSSYIDHQNKNDIEELKLIMEFRNKYPNAIIGIVVAMTSLRKTLQNVFRKIPDLNASMIISPSETFKKDYDLLIVDEAHRLRQYKNIGWMGVFKKNNRRLGLDDSGTELDWIIANSKNQIFFYDSAQSVKPSDIDSSRFNILLDKKQTTLIELSSQMRVLGGNDYITFVEKLLSNNNDLKYKFSQDNYELLVFDSLYDLYEKLSEKESEYGLCRLIAGYSWPWKSQKNDEEIDIEIDGLKFQWNRTDKDWINSKNAFKEVGCIHTTQGYDLNFTGVIFGKEISYNKRTNEIVIDPNNYYDKNGKRGIANQKDLKQYILNIYKTIMYRGIQGTYIYACDSGLRDYFKEHIKAYSKDFKLRVLKFEDVKPYVNSVPFVDVKAAAGNFSDLQIHSNFEWVELPNNVSVKEGYFVAQIIGESMNKRIPNGSMCLFQKDTGGSREGKIVLVDHYNIQDSSYGSGITIKMYSSAKKITEYGWQHTSITLKPLSYDVDFENIVLFEDEAEELKVRGIFIRVLDDC